jgi:hypothetical protein
LKDFALIVDNRPGCLADLGEALGKAGVNMEGICGIPCEGEGLIHILTKDAIATRKALEEANIQIREERDVLVIDIGHMVTKPGTGGEMARKIANAGVNIDLIYFGENNKLVLGVDDMEKARAAL